MAFAIVNGEHPVSSGWLTVPLTGRPVAYLKLATPGVPLKVDDPCTLEFQDGTTYRMTCARVGADGGFSRVVLVGGRARLETTLRAKHYEGIALATIARDAVTEAGERLGAVQLQGIAARWTRRAEPLVQTLEALVLGRQDLTWWLDASGAVHVGEPKWTARTGTINVLGDHPTANTFVCAVSPDLEPRRTVTVERAGAVFDVRAARIVHRIGRQLRTEITAFGGA
jgi:hypothetical protein